MNLIRKKAAKRKFGDNQIIRVSVRIMAPFIQLFGLYVIAHGHYSPGGGFQGGVVLGASFILLSLAFDLEKTLKSFSESMNAVMANIGVLIYTGTAILCALVGGLFLDYAALNSILPIGPIEWRSLGIFIVEIGVGFAVMSIMLSLYWDLSSGGDMDKGL